MKIKLNDVEKVTAQSKCYYDEENGNPYCNVKIQIFLKEKVFHPSYCRASNIKVEFSTGVCWGHYGKSGSLEVVRQFLEKIVVHKHYEQLLKKDWYMKVDVRCSYYSDVDQLVWE